MRQRVIESGTVSIDVIVKPGGSLLAHRALLDAALGAIARRAEHERIVVVPGGGPFADAVRRVDTTLALSSGAAHWMAILGMDQYAHLIADRMARAVVADDAVAIEAVLAESAIPVLAPSRWLRRVDPLPHSWDVTSDSIAAWFAETLRARRLVLIKPPGSAGDLVDPYFARALPAGVEYLAIPADRLDQFPDLR